MELAPIADRTTTAALGILVKESAGEGGLEALGGGWDKFTEADPIAAPVLAAAIADIAPLIETIVLIDDTAGRVKIDPKNPMHAKWIDLLVRTESQYEGMDDGNGRTFATRGDYVKMSAAQRRNHWYLTADHLVSALVDEQRDHVKKTVDRERDRLEKAAQKLGWSKSSASQPTTKPSAKPAQQQRQQSQPEVDKPLSPSGGRGAEIDTKGADPSLTGVDRALKTTASILFKRG